MGGSLAWICCPGVLRSRDEIRNGFPWDFPGSPVKNLLSNAGDARSTPGRGTKIPHAGGN